MRILYPERIALSHTILFAVILFVGQILSGTTFYFAGCIFAYILVATIAFNAVGGLYRASGAFIFFNAVIGLIFSQCLKLLLWEPAQSNLHSPNKTITVYLIGEMAVLLAALIAKYITPRKTLISPNDDLSKILQMAWGAFWIGASMIFIPASNTTGTLSSMLHQFAYFLPLSMILAVYYEIKISHGSRSLNAIAIISGGVTFLSGIASASKQGILTPLAAYVLVCAALKFKFKAYQLVAILLMGFICSVYLYPYAQVARNYRSSPDVIDIDIDLLMHHSRVSKEYKESVANSSDGYSGYYDNPMGFADRITLLPINALLIAHANEGYSPGLYPLYAGCANIIPHILWPNKPRLAGNQYAHDIGLLADDDHTTGITFGMFSEAYYMARWIGIAVLLPLFLLIAFFIWDITLPSIKHSPWGILMVVLLAHFSSEVYLSGLPTLAVTVTITLLVVIFITRSVLPPLGSLFTVANSAHKSRVGPPLPIPRRLPIRSTVVDS